MLRPSSEMCRRGIRPFPGPGTHFLAIYIKFVLVHVIVRSKGRWDLPHIVPACPCSVYCLFQVHNRVIVECQGTSSRPWMAILSQSHTAQILCWVRQGEKIKTSILGWVQFSRGLARDCRGGWWLLEAAGVPTVT